MVRRFEGLCGYGRLERHLEMKGTPLALLAIHPNAATHHSNQIGRDTEPQPGAAVPARRRAIHLFEGLEDELLLVGCYPDARIAYLEFRHQAPILHRLRRHLHQYRTA